jgi:hypothetical protein
MYRFGPLNIALIVNFNEQRNGGRIEPFVMCSIARDYLTFNTPTAMQIAPPTIPAQASSGVSPLNALPICELAES